MANGVAPDGGRPGNGRPRAVALASRRDAELAVKRARSEYASTARLVDSVQASLEQQQIDAETVATRRSLRGLTDLRALHMYPTLDVLDPYFLGTADRSTLLRRLLETAMTHSRADMGNVQLFDPVGRCLHLTAQCGFERPFLDFFRRVDGEGSACAATARSRAAVLVPDVTQSPLFSRTSTEVMREARAAAVQSIPLVSVTGQLLGVFSCHYHRTGWPSDDDVQLLSALSRAAVRSLQWQARPTGDGNGAAPIFGSAPDDRVPTTTRIAGQRHGQSHRVVDTGHSVSIY